MTAGANPSVSEATTNSGTLGSYAEQNIGYKDRLFLTGAVGSDQNSASGQAFKRVYDPRASVSYVLSDEASFPQWTWLRSVRAPGRLRRVGPAAGRQ